MAFVRRLLLVATILALPVTGAAQEAILTGTVTDSTGGVLPGVTVTAVLEATGNQFVAVTDESGIYRMPVRVGVYQITAELSGFATASRTGVQLLAGQAALAIGALAATAATGADSARAERPDCAPTAPSSRRTPSFSRRNIGRACESSSGFRCRTGGRSI